MKLKLTTADNIPVIIASNETARVTIIEISCNTKLEGEDHRIEAANRLLDSYWHRRSSGASRSSLRISSMAGWETVNAGLESYFLEDEGRRDLISEMLQAQMQVDRLRVMLEDRRQCFGGVVPNF